MNLNLRVKVAIFRWRPRRRRCSSTSCASRSVHLSPRHRGVGLCGTCTVLLDGEPVSSRIPMSRWAQGREITTVEGLPEDHEVVASFDKLHAFQRGYCGTGMGSPPGTWSTRATPAAARRSVRASAATCPLGRDSKIIEAIEEAAT